MSFLGARSVATFQRDRIRDDRRRMFDGHRWELGAHPNWTPSWDASCPPRRGTSASLDATRLARYRKPIMFKLAAFFLICGAGMWVRFVVRPDLYDGIADKLLSRGKLDAASKMFRAGDRAQARSLWLAKCS